MSVRSFPRAVSSLPDVFRFIDETLAGCPPTREALTDIRLAVDELLTNMVQHQPGPGADIEVSVERKGRSIMIGLIDHDVEPFDPTAPPDPDLDVHPGERREGGMGVYLARQVMESIHYDYDERLRRSSLFMEKILEA